MIANLVNIELAYINTNHPDFIGGRRTADVHGCLTSLLSNV